MGQIAINYFNISLINIFHGLRCPWCFVQSGNAGQPTTIWCFFLYYAVYLTFQSVAHHGNVVVHESSFIAKIHFACLCCLQVSPINYYKCVQARSVFYEFEILPLTCVIWGISCQSRRCKRYLHIARQPLVYCISYILNFTCGNILEFLFVISHFCRSAN